MVVSFTLLSAICESFICFISLLSHIFFILAILVSLCWRRQWQPTPVLLPGKSHGQGSLVGCSPWSQKSQIRLSDFTFTFHFHALEKEMAAHSSVLAWRIPGTVETDGLPSVGLHRVRHDWSDLATAAAARKINPVYNSKFMEKIFSVTQYWRTV